VAQDIRPHQQQIAARHRSDECAAASAESPKAADSGDGHAVGEAADQLIVAAGEQLPIRHNFAQRYQPR
jgi:hypothetical protein